MIILCLDEPSTLNYGLGETYVYKFHTQVTTQIADESEELNRFKVKGQAKLSSRSACDLLLTLEQVGIQTNSGQVRTHTLPHVYVHNQQWTIHHQS